MYFYGLTFPGQVDTLEKTNTSRPFWGAVKGNLTKKMQEIKSFWILRPQKIEKTPSLFTRDESLLRSSEGQLSTARETEKMTPTKGPTLLELCKNESGRADFCNKNK